VDAPVSRIDADQHYRYVKLHIGGGSCRHRLRSFARRGLDLVVQVQVGALRQPRFSI
jgi:hypothetical protein